MSKITDIEARYPEMVINLVEIFAKHDPSKTNKYLEYMAKITTEFIKSDEFIGGIEKCFEDVFELINKFDSFIDSPVIKNKDIYSYREVDELAKLITEAEKNKTEKYIKTNETITLYKDNEYTVVIPLSYESSKIYGANTQWCTTNKSSSTQFVKHTSNGVLIYVIINKSDVPDNYRKIAWHIQEKSNSPSYADYVSIWDSMDKQVKGFTETFELMNNVLSKDVRNTLLSVISKCEKMGYTTAKNQTELKELIYVH